MKIARVLPFALIMIVALLAAACGGGAASPTATPAPSGGESTPEGGGESAGGGPAAAVQGFFEALYTGGDISPFVCSTAGVADAYQAAADASAAAFQGAEIDVSGLTYTVSDETADSATVTVSGEIVYTVAGNATSSPFTEAAMSAVNEGGTWKFCGAAVPA
jgi:uncharacterized protein YdeI (BOF family)